MTIKDQLGNNLTFNKTPKRIVSLVPSQTELIVDMGLSEHLVGVTKFCVHPENLRKEKVVVGGTKQVHYDKIAELQPDIILCNKEENTREIVETLQGITKVHVSDIKNIEDALCLITDYGFLFDKEEIASQIATSITRSREIFLKTIDTSQCKPKVGYLIWKDPIMAVGSDTFIDKLLEDFGFDNAFKNMGGRYPEVQMEAIKELDYVFLSSEPYPFKEKDKEQFKKNTTASVVLVDGEYFSWYGSRLTEAYVYFDKLRLTLKL